MFIRSRSTSTDFLTRSVLSSVRTEVAPAAKGERTRAFVARVTYDKRHVAPARWAGPEAERLHAGRGGSRHLARVLLTLPMLYKVFAPATPTALPALEDDDEWEAA